MTLAEGFHSNVNFGATTGRDPMALLVAEFNNIVDVATSAVTVEGYRVETVRQILKAKAGQFVDVPTGAQLSDWLSQS